MVRIRSLALSRWMTLPRRGPRCPKWTGMSAGWLAGSALTGQHGGRRSSPPAAITKGAVLAALRRFGGTRIAPPGPPTQRKARKGPRKASRRGRPARSPCQESDRAASSRAGNRLLYVTRTNRCPWLDPRRRNLSRPLVPVRLVYRRGDPGGEERSGASPASPLDGGGVRGGDHRKHPGPCPPILATASLTFACLRRLIISSCCSPRSLRSACAEPKLRCSRAIYWRYQCGGCSAFNQRCAVRSASRACTRPAA